MHILPFHKPTTEVTADWKAEAEMQLQLGLLEITGEIEEEEAQYGIKEKFQSAKREIMWEQRDAIYA